MQPLNRLAAYEPGAVRSGTAAQIVEFEQLFAQCEGDVQACVFALLPHWSDAEEVVHGTRIVLWQKFDQFQAGTDFKAWARQVARYEVSNFRRMRQRDHVCFSDDLVASLTEVRSSLIDELERRRAALDQCLRKL